MTAEPRPPHIRPGPGEWVLLSYRVPREPSTPRIALPADARTREQLEWIADEAIEAGGTASIWLARPASLAQERELAAGMADARAAEYQAVIDEAAEAASSNANPAGAVRKLRGELRRIGRRDFFPPPERDRAHAAVRALSDRIASPQEEQA